MDGWKKLQSVSNNNLQADRLWCTAPLSSHSGHLESFESQFLSETWRNGLSRAETSLEWCYIFRAASKPFIPLHHVAQK